MTTARRETLLALAITAGALALRLFRLDHLSYWYDEALSIIAARLPLRDIAAHHVEQAIRNTYPPLYTYALHAWFAVLGGTPFAGRLFSAVAGSAAVFLLFVLIRRLASGAAGLLAAGLFAVSQIGVMYSQETRAYALLFVMAIGAAWFLDVALVERRAVAWYGFWAVCAALALTHYHSLWILVALWAFALAAPLFGLRALPLRWWVAGAMLCVVFVVPWLLAGGVAGIFAARDSRTALPSYFRASWATLYDVLGSFDNARWSGLLYPPDTKPRYAGIVLYTLPALLAVASPLRVLLTRPRSLGREEWGVIFLAVCAALSMVGPVAMAVLLHNVPYDIRYTSPGFGFYCGLVAIGALRLRPAAVRWAAIALMLVFGLMALRTNYFEPYKEDWRGAYAWLAESVRADDVTVFVPQRRPPPSWVVYHPSRPHPPYAQLEDVLERTPAGRVWLFVYGRTALGERSGRDAAVALERSGYARVDRRQYHWVDTSVWEKRGS